MRYILNSFFTREQKSLNDPLLLNDHLNDHLDEKHHQIDIKPALSVRDQLEYIQDNILNYQKTTMTQRHERVKKLYKLLNLCFAGVAIYGFYRTILILQGYNQLLNQFEEQYQHEILEDDKTCQQLTNTTLGCGTSTAYADFLSVANFFEQDELKECDDLKSEFCSLRSKNIGTIAGSIVLLLSTADFLYGGIFRHVRPWVYDTFTQKTVYALKGLDNDEINFLNDQTIAVDESTTVPELAQAIIQRKIAIGIIDNNREYYSPRIFNEFARDYLDPIADADGYNYLNSFN